MNELKEYILKKAMEKVASRDMQKQASWLDDIKGKIKTYWEGLSDKEKAAIIGSGAVGTFAGAFSGPAAAAKVDNSALKGLITAGTTAAGAVAGTGLGVAGVEGYDYIKNNYKKWFNKTQEVTQEGVDAAKKKYEEAKAKADAIKDKTSAEFKEATAKAAKAQEDWKSKAEALANKASGNDTNAND